MKSKIKNSKGQSLVEYLIIVALVGVGGIGVMRLLQNTLNVKFTNVIYALQGGKPKKAPNPRVRQSDYQKKDLSNFMNGAASGNEKK